MTPAFRRGPALLVIAGLSTLAVAHPVADKLAGQEEFFVAHGADALDVALVVTCGYLAVPLVLWAPIALVAGRAPAAAATSLHALLSALVYVALVAPLDAALPGPAAVSVAAALAVAFAVAWRRSAELRAVLPALVVAPLASAGMLVSGLPAMRAPAPSAARPIAQPVPIVVVVLDELPLHALLDENLAVDAVRYPSFGALAATSHWFRNATGVATHTPVAIPALLTGRYPPETKHAPSVASYPDNLFTLLAGTYSMDVHEKITQLCPPELCPPEHGRGARLAALLADLAAVWTVSVVPGDLGVPLPRIDGNWTGLWSDTDAESGAGRRDRFDRVLASLVPSDAPTLHYAHHTVPHMPYQFLPSGRVYGARSTPGALGDDGWSADPRVRVHMWQQFLLQVQYADREVGRVLDRLRAQGMFDDALLVVTADHGVSFAPGDVRRGDADRANFYEDVLSVPLFVKLPGQREGVVDDRSVESIDVLPTIAALVGAELPADVDGQPLFAASWSPRPVKRAMVSAAGRRAFRSHTRYRAVEFALPDTLPRATLDERVAAFGTGARSLWNVGPSPELVGTTPAPAGDSGCTARLLSAGDRWPGGRATVADDRRVPAHLVGGLTCAGEPPAALAVAVDGRIAVTTAPFREGSAVRFEVLIPDAVLTDGEHALSLLAAEASLRSIPIAPR